MALHTRIVRMGETIQSGFARPTTTRGVETRCVGTCVPKNGRGATVPRLRLCASWNSARRVESGDNTPSCSLTKQATQFGPFLNSCWLQVCERCGRTDTDRDVDSVRVSVHHTLDQ